MIVDTALREREANGQSDSRRNGRGRRNRTRHCTAAWHTSTGDSSRRLLRIGPRNTVNGHSARRT